MSDINACVISGEVMEKPRVGSTKNGKTITNIRIKSQRSFSGSKSSDSYDWFTVSVFGVKADEIGRTVKLGDRVIVNGAVHVRSYDKPDGSKGMAVEINTVDVSVIQSAVETARGIARSQPSRPVDDFVDDEIPF